MVWLGVGCVFSLGRVVAFAAGFCLGAPLYEPGGAGNDWRKPVDGAGQLRFPQRIYGGTGSLPFTFGQ